MTPTILDFQAALTLLRNEAASLPLPGHTEPLPLAQSLNRILATPVLTQRDQPPFDRATRDGFAVRALHFSATRTAQLIGQLKAGDAWQGPPLHPASPSRS